MPARIRMLRGDVFGSSRLFRDHMGEGVIALGYDSGERFIRPFADTQPYTLWLLGEIGKILREAPPAAPEAQNPRYV